MLAADSRHRGVVSTGARAPWTGGDVTNAALPRTFLSGLSQVRLSPDNIRLVTAAWCPFGAMSRHDDTVGLSRKFDPKQTSSFQAETDPRSVAPDGQRGRRTQAFQLNYHLVGEIVGGVTGAGLTAP
jgi:hypothetical protein